MSTPPARPTRICMRLFACLLLSGTPLSNAHGAIRPMLQHSGVDVRLRGVSAVDGNVAWASGQQGTVLRTIDGGAHWVARPVPDASALDFRDIEAFDADTAVVVAIGPGDASRINRTADGGATWALVLRNSDPRAFFDCMAFEGQRGWMLGDPVDGRFEMWTSADGGRHWIAAFGPSAVDGEAAFAASGTCIARGHGSTVVATGGAAPALRVRRDGVHQAWQRLPMPADGAQPGDGANAHRTATRGLFSVVATDDDDAFLAVGGDYLDDREPAPAAMTVRTTLAERVHDGEVLMPSMHGHAIENIAQTRGYRSGVDCLQGKAICIAVGPSGVDQLRDGLWTAVSAEGFDAVSITGGTAWMVGDGGRIARMVLDD